jgi:methyl-accepting chemotaxis protein
MIISLAAALVVGIVLVRSIRRSLHTAAALANRVANGDLTANPDDRQLGNDEMAQLMVALHKMVQGLRTVVGEVRKHFEATIYQTCIPRSVRLGEAPSFGQTILEYDAHGPAATASRSASSDPSADHCARRSSSSATSISTGIRIQRGGSCGVFGTSKGLPWKKTSCTNRRE